MLCYATTYSPGFSGVGASGIPMHETSLLTSLVVALVAAFAGGLLATRLKVSPIVGYLLAGLAIGPLTPGPTADPGTALALADIGVILLMFGVGIHFSLREIHGPRIAVPGAIIPTAFLTAVGAGLGLLWGWSTGGAIVFGVGIAVASTVIVLRSLTNQNKPTRRPAGSQWAG